ncbi:MAG: quinone-dependent dihydroorotate dehydrogenase [Geminicoccaceae bacterium]
MLTRALHLLPPESAHGLALRALGRGLAPTAAPVVSARLRTSFCGIELAHPLGLAAGFDKDALATRGLFRLGFSFVEIGTVTPRPQAGNPKPRLFRLRREQALINRMGFNNQGLAAVCARLAARDRSGGPLGANIGANRDSADPVADYVACLRALYPLVDYVAINVSSPNTPGLRDLQQPARLDELLAALLETRQSLAGDRRPKPLLVKIAPDLAPDDEVALADVVTSRGVDGLIVGNTTIARPPVVSGRHRDEAGGLSGAPLFLPSTEQLLRLHRLIGRKLPLIGVGGILRGADAYAKVRAGAAALQLYTALIYRGPRAVVRILAELERLLERDDIRLSDACGIDAAA